MEFFFRKWSSITDLFFRFIASCVLSGACDASMWRCSVVRADRTLPLWWSLHSSLMPTVSGLASWQQCHAVTFWYWEWAVDIHSAVRKLSTPSVSSSHILCAMPPFTPLSRLGGIWFIPWRNTKFLHMSKQTLIVSDFLLKFLQLPRFERSVCECSFMIQS